MGTDEASQEVLRDGKSAAVFAFKGLVKNSWELTKKAQKAIKAYNEGKGDIRGKQSIKDLSAKNTEKSMIDVEGKIDGFQKYAKEFGVDYAAVYDKQKNQTLLVFQSKDNETLNKAFQNYLDGSIKKDAKESIVNKITKIEAAQVAAPAAAAAKGIGKAVEAGANVAKQAVNHSDHAR